MLETKPIVLNSTSLDFNYVKPYLVMWQSDLTIGLMVGKEVLSCLPEVLSRSART